MSPGFGGASVGETKMKQSAADDQLLQSCRSWSEVALTSLGDDEDEDEDEDEDDRSTTTATSFDFNTKTVQAAGLCSSRVGRSSIGGAVEPLSKTFKYIGGVSFGGWQGKYYDIYYYINLTRMNPLGYKTIVILTFPIFVYFNYVKIYYNTFSKYLLQINGVNVIIYEKIPFLTFWPIYEFTYCFLD